MACNDKKLELPCWSHHVKDAWVEKNAPHVTNANKCMQLMHLCTFWQNVEKIVGITKTFVDLLRLVDSVISLFLAKYIVIALKLWQKMSL